MPNAAIDRGVRPGEPCAYCGADRSLKDDKTKDHVIPRQLFPSNYPGDRITVPSCSRCNKEKQPDDEFLRDLLVADYRSSASPSRAEPWAKMQRATRRAQSELGMKMRAEARPAAQYTPNGLYLGHTMDTTIDRVRAEMVFARLVRGLYYYVTRTQLSTALAFNIKRVDALYADALADNLRRDGSGRLCIGDATVFECIFLIDATDEWRTEWLLRFYQGSFIGVSTTSQHSSDDRENAVSPTPS